MQWRWFAAAAALTVLPPALQAQQPVRGVQPPSSDSTAEDAIIDLVMNRRARLGVKVNLLAQHTDSMGAYLEAVSPGGPAARAGLRSGDIITRFNGTSLLQPPDGPYNRGQSLPGLRLIELVARLQPGDTANVEYRRGNVTRRAVLVMGGDHVVLRGSTGKGVFEARPVAPVTGALPRNIPAPAVELFLEGSLADLQLAPINPELGRYFGTSRGVLVLSVPKASPLGLRGGDVVLAVDGRVPASPSHLLRILRSYGPDEPFRLYLMRNRKRDTIIGRLTQPQEQP